MQAHHARIATWSISSLILLPMYIASAVLVYWGVENVPPMQINYQHALMLSQPATNREEAELYEVAEANGGETVYFYEEYCLSEQTHGEVIQSFVDGVVYRLPTRDTLGVEGCNKRAFPVELPSFASEAHVVFMKRIDYDVNPIKKLTVEYRPVPIRILPPLQIQRVLK